MGRLHVRFAKHTGQKDIAMNRFESGAYTAHKSISDRRVVLGQISKNMGRATMEKRQVLNSVGVR